MPAARRAGAGRQTDVVRSGVDGVHLAPPGPLTVLFVDNRNWGCFFQLESGLRRAGFRTVRVTTGTVSRADNALCFDRTVRLRSVDELERLPEILEGENVIDVQVVESLAVATFGALARMPGSPHYATWARRRAAVDKLYVSDVLHRRGLHTPETVPAYLTSAEYVADVLGLPAVHKPRRGSGGTGVSIVRTMKDLREILAGDGGTEDYFFERFIDGTPLQFSGVIANGQALLSATYQTLDRRCDNGPASSLRCIEDSALEETGELVAGRWASTAWSTSTSSVTQKVATGSTTSIPGCGAPAWPSVRHRSISAMRTSPTSVALCREELYRRAPVGSEVTVFPAAVESSTISGATGFGMMPFARGVWPYFRWLGPKYAAYESVRHLRRIAHELVRPDAAEASGRWFGPGGPPVSAGAGAGAAGTPRTGGPPADRSSPGRGRRGAIGSKKGSVEIRWRRGRSRRGRLLPPRAPRSRGRRRRLRFARRSRRRDSRPSRAGRGRRRRPAHHGAGGRVARWG